MVNVARWNFGTTRNCLNNLYRKMPQKVKYSYAKNSEKDFFWHLLMWHAQIFGGGYLSSYYTTHIEIFQKNCRNDMPKIVGLGFFGLTFNVARWNFWRRRDVLKNLYRKMPQKVKYLYAKNSEKDLIG